MVDNDDTKTLAATMGARAERARTQAAPLTAGCPAQRFALEDAAEFGAVAKRLQDLEAEVSRLQCDASAEFARRRSGF